MPTSRWLCESSGKVCRRRLFALATVPAVVVAVSVGVGPSTPLAEAADCDNPAQALDLTSWKLQTPRGADGGGIVEIKQPQLATYVEPPHFVSRGCGAGIAFRAPIDGAHTSGSKYARTELREMTGDGRTNAAWSSTSGTHIFTETIAFTSLPTGKPDVVGAQIHNASEDISLLVLRGTQLYITDGGKTPGKGKLVNGNYRLGTKVNMKWVVSDGVTKAYVDGVPQLSFEREYEGAYFKAGAYPQADCDSASPCDSSNYGATLITKLAVTHSGTDAAVDSSEDDTEDDAEDDSTDEETESDPDFDF